MENFRTRPDITNALIHLTADRSEQTAYEALVSIMKDGIIRGSGNSGFVKGKQSAACFTEMPLSVIRYHIEHSKKANHAYSNYGIALSKKKAWENGIRPVIYLPDSEANWIPDDEKWRHVQFDYGNVDFTHEREWRVKGDFRLNGIGLYVIVPDKETELKLLEIISDDAKRHIIGFLHMNYLNALF